MILVKRRETFKFKGQQYCLATVCKKLTVYSYNFVVLLVLVVIRYTFAYAQFAQSYSKKKYDYNLSCFVQYKFIFILINFSDFWSFDGIPHCFSWPRGRRRWDIFSNFLKDIWHWTTWHLPDALMWLSVLNSVSGCGVTKRFARLPFQGRSPTPILGN